MKSAPNVKLSLSRGAFRVQISGSELRVASETGTLTAEVTSGICADTPAARRPALWRDASTGLCPSPAMGGRLMLRGYNAILSRGGSAASLGCATTRCAGRRRRHVPSPWCNPESKRGCGRLRLLPLAVRRRRAYLPVRDYLLMLSSRLTKVTYLTLAHRSLATFTWSPQNPPYVFGQVKLNQQESAAIFAGELRHIFQLDKEHSQQDKSPPISTPPPT